jgi:acyl-CoA reductase-like NAD-dependent aldehyde dehydrogenase
MANGIKSDLDFSTFHNVINGKLTDTKTTRCGINPGTNEELSPCPVSTQQDVYNAIEAARVAFKSWSKTTVESRKEKLMAFAAAFTALKPEFGKLLTKEQGKAVRTVELASTLNSVADVLTDFLRGTRSRIRSRLACRDLRTRYALRSRRRYS